MADKTERTPEWIEIQRQNALSALSAALVALRSGMIATVQTKVALAEGHLRAMAPSGAA